MSYIFTLLLLLLFQLVKLFVQTLSIQIKLSKLKGNRLE